MQPKAFRFEDPMFENDYGMFKAYANSKLALLMFAEELQHRLINEKSNVIVNSVNPGGYLFRGMFVLMLACLEGGSWSSFFK